MWFVRTKKQAGPSRPREHRRKRVPCGSLWASYQQKILSRSQWTLVLQPASIVQPEPGAPVGAAAAPSTAADSRFTPVPSGSGDGGARGAPSLDISRRTRSSFPLAASWRKSGIQTALHTRRPGPFLSGALRRVTAPAPCGGLAAAIVRITSSSVDGAQRSTSDLIAALLLMQTSGEKKSHFANL